MRCFIASYIFIALVLFNPIANKIPSVTSVKIIPIPAIAMNPAFTRKLSVPSLSTPFLIATIPHYTAPSFSHSFSLVASQLKIQSVTNSKKARFLTCLMKMEAFGGTLIYHAR